jgi:hypothetical protein
VKADQRLKHDPEKWIKELGRYGDPIQSHGAPTGPIIPGKSRFHSGAKMI